MSTGTSTRPAPDPTRPGLRARAAADPARLVAAGAAVLIGLHVVVRTAVAAQGWFHLDDLLFVEQAVRAPGDLLAPHAGHLMPGGHLLTGALTAVVPLHWPAVVAVEAVLLLALDVAVWRLLVLLFGLRPAVLLPLAVWTTTALTLPAVWWAVAVNQLPGQLATVLALTAAVRRLRGGGPGEVLRVAAWLAVGLAFSERVLLAVPLVLAVALLWFGTGGPIARVRALWREQRLLVLACGAVAVPYALYYLAAVPTPFPGGGADAGGLEVARFAVPAVLTGLLGGPWRWSDVPPTIPGADPPPAGVAAAAVVVAAVVVASVLRRRGAARAWLLPLGAFAAVSALLGASRAQVFAPVVFAGEYRYLTEVALAAVLALGFAFLPVRDAPAVLRPRRRDPRVRPAVAAGAAVVLVAALVAGAVGTAVGYAQRWSVNPARDYVTAARADLAAAPGTVLVDGPVPDGVLWAPFAPRNLVSTVLAAVPEAPAFLVDGAATPRLRMLDASGHVRAAWVPPVGEAPPGPVPDCGYGVFGTEPVTVPLRVPVGDLRWTVRITWLSALDNAAVVTAGEQQVPVDLPAGLNEVFLQVTGQVDRVDIRLRDGQRPLCVGQVEVGLPQALPEGF